MKSSTTNRNTLILLILLVVALAISYPLLNKSEDTSGVSSDQLASVQEAENILAKMQNVSIDFSFFDKPEFAYLKDISSPLLTLPVGRVNPFAPIK